MLRWASFHRNFVKCKEYGTCTGCKMVQVKYLNLLRVIISLKKAFLSLYSSVPTIKY